MKRFYLVLSVLIASLLMQQQSAVAQSYVWAKSFGGPSKDKGRDVGVDLAGNSYVTGFFKDSATFGAYKVFTVDTNDEDIFLAKFDVNGVPQWAHSFGNAIEDHTDFPYGFGVNNDGYSVMTGICGGYIKFEKGDSIGTGNANDMFLIVHDFAGNPLWAKVGGWGDKVQYGSAAYISNDGTIYCAGNFGSDTLNLFGDSLLTFTTKLKRFFVASYDLNGELLWVTTYESEGNLESRDIKGDELGNIYISGNYSSTFNIENASATSLGSEDAFIVKLKNNGNFIWLKSYGSSLTNSSECGYSLAIDNDNNFYTTSIFNDNVTFEGNTITTGAKRNIVVASWDKDGNFRWANVIVGSPESLFSIFCLGLLAEDNVIVTGCFSGTITINGMLTVSPYGDPLYSDVFFAAFSPADGQGQWLTHAGGTDTDAGFGLAGNHSGFAFATGNFHYDGTFGPFTLVADGITDGYLVKFHQNDYLTTPGGLTTKNVSAFPVPTSGALNIAIPENASLLKISDAYGRIVLTKEVVSSSNESLDLSSLCNGVYYVQIHGNTSIYAIKVILQK